MAQLYRDNWLCYDYDPRDQSCSLIENLVEGGDGAIQINRINRIRLNPQGRRELGAVAPFEPEGVWVYHRQSLVRVRDGLCQSRARRVQDAYEATLVLVQRVDDPDSPFELLEGDMLGAYREALANQARNSESDEICARYRRSPGDPGYLYEESWVDGRRPTGDPVRIAVLPRSGPIPHLRWQN